MLTLLSFIALLVWPSFSYLSVVGTPRVFSCTNTNLADVPSTVTRLTSGTVTYVTGYRQVSSINKDPIIARYDNNVQTWCRDNLETTGDDQEGTGILLDDQTNRLYMTFTCTGNQGLSSQDFRQYATNGWLTGCGGGPASTRAILAQINMSTGTPILATFIYAQLSNGDGNTWKVTELGMDTSNGNLILKANSFFSPLNVDKTRQSCSGSSPFVHYISFLSNLTKAVQSCAERCNGTTPDCDVITITNPTTTGAPTPAPTGPTNAPVATNAPTVGSNGSQSFFNLSIASLLISFFISMRLF